jgi:hypothetical protein
LAKEFRLNCATAIRRYTATAIRRRESCSTRPGSEADAALAVVLKPQVGFARGRVAPRLLKNSASPPEPDGYAREKNAGSVDSSAIDATEDVLSRRPAHF